MMKIINQSHEILHITPDLLQLIERAGRTCYQSGDKITPDSAGKFVSMLIKKGHHAMIEFGDITVKFITNRGVSHELVRHRLCSFAQESTRYVKYNGNMEFIRPVWQRDMLEDHCFNWTQGDEIWLNSMVRCEKEYKELLADGWKPEQAREVLPNALKTEIIMKGNVREWRHILKLRTSKQAHPQIRALMKDLLVELKEKVPVIFDDINPVTG